jgi:hypothetical protein
MNQQQSDSSVAGAPDYDALFSRPLLPPDPPVKAEHPNFLCRTRNSLWWIVIVVVISGTALAFMKSDFTVGDVGESGCGDTAWWMP